MFLNLGMLSKHVIEWEGGGQQASCLVAKQAVEFPQVLASMYIPPCLLSQIHAVPSKLVDASKFPQGDHDTKKNTTCIHNNLLLSEQASQ